LRPVRRHLRPGTGALVAALLAVAGTGCGFSADEEPPEEARAAEPPRTRTVETTRVEVVEDVDGKGNGLNPALLYKRLAPGVVTVISIFGEEESAEPGGGEGGLGSGFVLDDKGYVATNAHVVTTGEGSELKRADEVYVEFADGNRVDAEIIGDDPNSDVALLKLDPGGLSLTPLRLGKSSSLQVGAPVAAIGSPFGEQQSLSIGVISAIDRDIESLTAFAIGNAIQTDAAINRGNSGGPLLDARGRVIGINSQIKSTSGGGEGVGFAVPVDTVSRSLEQLRDKGTVDYGYLGVSSQQLYPQLAERLDVDADTGALVADVEPDSPADDAGLESGDDKIDFQGQREIPENGDVIVSVDGDPLDNANNLGDLISLKSPGDKVRLEVFRDGKSRTVTVTLEERPDRAPEAPPEP